MLRKRRRGKDHENASAELSLNDLVSPNPPTTRRLIKAVRAKPKRLLRATLYFTAELSKPVQRREKPILDPSECVKVPEFKEFSDPLSCADHLGAMSQAEVDAANHYSAKAYNARKSPKKL
jgi:hypothetical protein